MTDLTELHQDVQAARERYETAAERFHQAVAQRLAEGTSAVQIAEQLGVTRSRVYQWARKA
jgi:DNA-directed RNA polymerase specialized sigma24 family protein